MAKRLYINANCQGPALKAMLSEVLPDWTIMALAVHETHEPDEIGEAVAFMRSADVILSQPISDDWGVPEFRTSFIRTMAASSVRMIIFPSIYFQGQLLTLHPLKVDGVKVSTPGWAYTDGLVAFLVAAGEPIGHIAEVMSSRDLFDGQAIDARIRGFMEFNAWYEREMACDVIVTDMFREAVGSRILMHTFNHPTRFVMAEVCNRLLDRMGERARVNVAGEDHLTMPRFPILPSIASHFPELSRMTDHRLHWPAQAFSHHDYIAMKARDLMAADRQLLRMASWGHPQFGPFLSAWRETTPLRDRLSERVLAIEPHAA